MNGPLHECYSCGRMTAEEDQDECDTCAELAEREAAAYRREHDYGAER